MTTLVVKEGKQYGPYEIHDLVGYVSKGSFVLTDLCWQYGWSEWQPLSSVISSPDQDADPEKTKPIASFVSKQSEETFWEGHANFWRYAGQIILSLLIGLAVAVHSFGIALLIMPSWWAMIYIDRKRRKYIITNKRVKVEFGLFSKSTKEVLIRDIKSINVLKNGISGLVGIGTLEFSSAGGPGVEVSFVAINNAQKVKNIVSALQD